MTAPIQQVVDGFERYDYARYLKQVKALSREQTLAILKDWRLYRRAFLWVTETLPDGVVRAARFHPRPWQARYEEERTLNDVALKARKVGFSTDVLLEMYAKAATTQYFKAAMLSHEENATKRLFQILRVAHDMNPMKPELSSDSRSRMAFKWTKADISLGTAGARVYGRGDNLNLLHLSEVAHFYKKVEDVDNFMAGVSEAVVKGGRMVLESTPNGEDPLFHPQWQATQEGELWHGRFLSFFDDESNDWPVDHPLALPSTKRERFDLSPYEQSLMQRHGLSLGYIRFLRFEKQKLRSRSLTDPTSSAVMGDEEMLRQEYPVDSLSCFLISDDTVFDQAMVHKYRQAARPPMFIEQSGRLQTWERALIGRAYVIGVDTSEGLPTSTWQAAAVLDVEKLKYVAFLRVKTDLADMTRLIMKLAEDYNDALLMVERNMHGHSVLQMLDMAGYANIYYHEERGTMVRGGERRWGWPTRADTKPSMIADFKELFEAGAFEIHSEIALQEIASYRHYDPREYRNRSVDAYRAPKHGTDDLLMAMMIAAQGRWSASSGRKAEVVRYGTMASKRGLP